MAIKFYTVEKEINGVTYRCQFSGISAALRAVDESYIEGTSNTSVEKLAEYLFKYIVVEPKGLTVDDFESMEEFQQVMNFAQQVMKGDFREKTDESTTETESKK